MLANTTTEEENLYADILRLESELLSYSTEGLEGTNNLQTIQESERNESEGLEDTNNLQTIQESETNEFEEEVYDIDYEDVESILSEETEHTNQNLQNIFQEPETHGSEETPNDI